MWPKLGSLWTPAGTVRDLIALLIVGGIVGGFFQGRIDAATMKEFGQYVLLAYGLLRTADSGMNAIRSVSNNNGNGKSDPPATSPERKDVA